MSGLDYSTFSIYSALTPSQPASARSYPDQQHVPEDVMDSHICNAQREDLPSSSNYSLPDRPRERALTHSGPYQGQGPSAQAFAFPRPPLRTDPADDIQGNILCTQLGEFHFNPQYGGHGGPVDEPVNAPTAIIENPSWSSHHSLHYPTPVRGSFSQSIKGSGPIPEDSRPRLTTLYCDVSARVPARRASMVVADQQLGRSTDYGLSSPLPSMAMDVGAFFPGGMITSPSPPPTAYQDDDFSGADRPHAFTYSEHLPAMTRSTAHEHFSLDRQTAQSLGGFSEAAHQNIISLDHRFETAMATPFPGYTSSQSPHDHPIYESPSFSTAIHAEELPRPGSAPPLIVNQVPFVGDARAALQSSSHEYAPSCDVNRPHAGWYPQPAAPSASQSPRSSPRRAGSIGHNSQKTPPGSRHLRRWSSVTNPALRASPPSFTPNVVPFPRYPAGSQAQPSSSSDNTSFSHFSPCSESESDDLPLGYVMSPLPPPLIPPAVELAEAGPAEQQPPPQSAPQASQSQQQQPQPPMRAVVRCDGHLIDEESWTAAFSRPDKLVHVYECFWDLAHTPCGMWIEGDQSSVADHLALFHGFRGGEVTTRCLWRECPKPHMKGTSIARHVVTHVGFRIKCHACKHEFARVDACNRAHSRSGCLGVGQPMYGELQRVVDARKADSLVRPPSKKRRTDE